MRIPSVALACCLVSACSPHSEEAIDQASWHSYRSTYIEDSGRVVDDGLAGISHSEGQAYAMLLATAADDRQSFDRVWSWTRTHLGVREDRLAAWKWDPDNGSVVDRNNASDADLLATWALLRAADRWGDVEYSLHARRQLADIRQHLIRDTAYGPVLLPGAEGFVHDGDVTVNLSYWVFPALASFAEVDPDGPWQAVIESGVALIERATIGEHRLPPDWLALSKTPAPSSLYPPRFGFDAIRIPLYACWGRLDVPALGHVEKFWSDPGSAPAWVDLVTGEPAGFALQPGGEAIRNLLQSCIHGDEFQPAPMDSSAGYYDNTLILLARVASHERNG